MKTIIKIMVAIYTTIISILALTCVAHVYLDIEHPDYVRTVLKAIEKEIN